MAWRPQRSLAIAVASYHHANVSHQFFSRKGITASDYVQSTAERLLVEHSASRSLCEGRKGTQTSGCQICWRVQGDVRRGATFDCCHQCVPNNLVTAWNYARPSEAGGF